jgi:hypothetical protein
MIFTGSRNTYQSITQVEALTTQTRFFLVPQARAQLLPASRGSQHARFSRVGVEARFWLAGTQCSEARKKNSPSDLRHSPSCIQMVYVDFMPENERVRLRREEAFFDVAERFRSSNDPAEVKQLGDALGRFVFGESQIESVEN